MFGIFKKWFGHQPVNFKELVKNGAIIVDVRSVAEYKTGHISRSRNYPLDTLHSKIADLKKINKPVITVCRSGARSSVAKGILKTAGIEVYNGGAWASLKNKIA